MRRRVCADIHEPFKFKVNKLKPCQLVENLCEALNTGDLHTINSVCNIQPSPVFLFKTLGNIICPYRDINLFKIREREHVVVYSRGLRIEIWGTPHFYLLTQTGLKVGPVLSVSQ